MSRRLPPSRRRALAGCSSTAGQRQLQQGGSVTSPGAADWSRVLAMPPPSVVLVTGKNAPPRRRWFAEADASSLSLLDLSDDIVPRAAARVALAMATARTESFAAMRRGHTFQEDGVRVGRDGVFVGDRRVWT